MARSLTKAVRDHADRLFGFHDISAPPMAGADVIIGLGSYQPAVANYCADLFAQRVAPLILFTGGVGNWTRGVLDRPEAELFRERVLERGAPEAAVLLELSASNLGENARFARDVLLAEGIEADRIVVVTKRNTTRRARATFRVNWPDCFCTVRWPTLALDRASGFAAYDRRCH